MHIFFTGCCNFQTFQRNIRQISCVLLQPWVLVICTQDKNIVCSKTCSASFQKKGFAIGNTVEISTAHISERSEIARWEPSLSRIFCGRNFYGVADCKKFFLKSCGTSFCIDPVFILCAYDQNSWLWSAISKLSDFLLACYKTSRNKSNNLSRKYQNQKLNWKLPG